MNGFDGDRFAAFLYARQRRLDVIERGAGVDRADAVFREWFVGQDEQQTGADARMAVALNLGAMRLAGELGRGQTL